MASAPPLSFPAPEVPEGNGGPGLRVNGLLRDVREEAEDLLRAITAVIDKGTLTDPQSRSREVLAAFSEAVPVFAADKGQIDERLAGIRKLFDDYDSVYDTYGDGVTRIENAWKRAAHLWAAMTDAGATSDPDALIRVLGRMRDPLHETIFESAFLTIPPRVNRHLRQLRIGQALDFAAGFADELSDAADRTKVLRFLADHPGAVEGVIDVEAGKIYRASPEASRRRLSFVLIGGLILLGALAIYLLGNLGAWLGLAGWPLTGARAVELIVTYATVMVGAGLHIVVDALKQERDKKGKAFTALEEWALWIHIKETAILVSVVTLWIGFVGLVLTVVNPDWLTALAVGYSIDSIADLYLQRFTKSVDASTAAIQTRLQ